MVVTFQIRCLTYEIFELVDSEPGVWCDKCMLPSAFRVTLATQLTGGPLKLSIGNRCMGPCGRWF